MAVKWPLARADTPGVRLSLTHKFVLGSLAVAAAAVGAPPVAAAFGVVPWVTPFVVFGVAGGLGYALSRGLSRNLGPVLDVTSRIGRGDLAAPSVASAGSQFPDESDELLVHIVAMLDSLRGLVGRVQSTADGITASASELERSVGSMNTAAGDISGTVSEVAKGSTHQQELLGDVTRLITDIASAIEMNASRAREAFGFAAEANQKANSGVDVSRLAIEKMRSVFERVEQAGNMVFQLEAKTRHVHQITEIITSVASRTNLLSLNASIEAARAGEAGRGFAVVADEIRKLAESVARSADEISKLIGEIEADTQNVADEMRHSGQVITEGRDDVNTIAHSLEQIRSAVGEAAARAEEIFQEADDQARQAERMVQSMDEVSSVSRANAGSVDDVAELSRRQLDAMSAMVNATQALSAQSTELRETVHRFETPAEDES